VLLLELFLAAQAGSARGHDKPASQGQALAKQRPEIIPKTIADSHLHSGQIEPDSALRFRDNPLLRYNDPSRPGDNDPFKVDRLQVKVVGRIWFGSA
jgi:hypothetical protein